jgi:hypothetical protein
MQTFRAIASLMCRVVLLGIAAPVLLSDFPNYRIPSRFATDWTVIVVCDALAVLAPLARPRKIAFLAAAAVLGAHYYFRHLVPTWDIAYIAMAILLVLLPASGRTDGKKKRQANLFK